MSRHFLNRAAFILNEEGEAGSGGGGGGGEGVRSGFDLTWVESKPLLYAGVACAVVCCFVSFRDLREHLSRLDYPVIQVLEMRIILMIPIYAVFSALSLIFMQWRFFFVTVRDTYESIVLYIFFMLMIAYCGGEGQLLRSLKAKRYKGMHPFPMCWIPSFPLDTAFYLRCKRWVLQCALIKPVCSFIAMVCHPIGIYNENNFKLNNVYTYTCVIVNFSLTWALYYLVLFEIECEKELHYAKTFLKFLCVKSIIFFSYWQSVVISLAVSAGLLYMGSNEDQQEEVSAVIQDLLMCFELLPVAFMHRAAFGRDKLDHEMAAVPVYMKNNNTGDLRTNVDTALNVRDIVDDTIGTIFYRRGKLVDQENADDEDTMDATMEGRANDAGTAAERRATAAAVASSAAAKEVGGGDIFARDPTLDELVRHAVMTDYGVRVDGVLHYDEESDRDERNRDMAYTDTDVILHRSRHENAGQDVRVDTDMLRSSQVQKQQQQQAFGTPQIYCVVCGRFDREMVRRRNGYKCKECVGTKSQSLLRHRQREALNENEEGARLDGITTRLGASTTMVSNGSVGPLSASAAGTATLSPPQTRLLAAGGGEGDEYGDDDDDHYVQPMPQQPDADLAGVQVTMLGETPSPAAVIVGGLNNLNQMLRNALLPEGLLGGGGGNSSSNAAAAGESVGGGNDGGQERTHRVRFAEDSAPTCRTCGQSTHMVPIANGKWRCAQCTANLGM